MTEEDDKKQDDVKNESDLIVELKKDFDAKIKELNNKLADRDKTIKELMDATPRIKGEDEDEDEEDEEDKKLNIEDYISGASNSVQEKIKKRYEKRF